MGEGLLHHDPLVGVEGEHLLQQVQRLRVSVGVELAPGDLWFVRERLDVGPAEIFGLNEIFCLSHYDFSTLNQ